MTCIIFKSIKKYGYLWYVIFSLCQISHLNTLVVKIVKQEKTLYLVLSVMNILIL